MKPGENSPLWRFFWSRYAHHEGLDSPAGRLDAEIQVRHFHRWWEASGKRRRGPGLGDLSAQNISAAMAWLIKERKVQPVTANKLAANMLAMANFGFENRLLSAPPRRVKKHKRPQRRPEAWWPEQIGRLLFTARQSKGTTGDGIPWAAVDECLVRLLNNSGERLGAIAVARWEWADLDGQVPTLRIPAEARKDAEDMPVSLDAETVAALKAIRVPGQDDIWGCLTFRGRRITNRRDCLRKRFARIVADTFYPGRARTWADCKRLNGRRNGPQKMRRSFATAVWFDPAGGPEAARRLCGHSSAKTTEDNYVDPTHAPALSHAQLAPKISPQPAVAALAL